MSALTVSFVLLLFPIYFSLFFYFFPYILKCLKLQMSIGSVFSFFKNSREYILCAFKIIELYVHKMPTNTWIFRKWLALWPVKWSWTPVLAELVHHVLINWIIKDKFLTINVTVQKMKHKNTFISNALKSAQMWAGCCSVLIQD